MSGGGMRGRQPTSSPPAVRHVDVEEALRLLQAASERQSAGAASVLAPLVRSASHLAAQCTPALFSTVLDACDATLAVEASPKKLTMLNAAWKLLLTIASHAGVPFDDFNVAVTHMIDRLRWGVLTHDWSDKTRVRLATFFASHVVSAIRAHPRWLLASLDAGPDTATSSAVPQLVRLYLAVCVTLATSARDATALAALHDNIIVRLHAIFHCLGGAAVALDEEACAGAEAEAARCGAVDEGEDGAAAAGPSRAASPHSAHALQALLAQCVSTAAAHEIEEAAESGPTARMATATAALSLYLHVVRGALEATTTAGAEAEAGQSDSAPLSHSRHGSSRDPVDDAAAEGAVAGVAVSCGSSSRQLPRAALSLLQSSLVWWTQPAAPQEVVTETDGPADVDALRDEVVACAAALPLGTFADNALSQDVTVAASGVSLRAMWTDSLATVWLHALRRRGAHLSGTGEGSEELAVSSVVRTAFGSSGEDLAAHVLASLANALSPSSPCTPTSPLPPPPPTSTAPLLLLDAWALMLERAESAAASAVADARDDAAHLIQALLQVMADLRCGAALMVESLLRLSSPAPSMQTSPDRRDPASPAHRDGGNEDTAAGAAAAARVLRQWIGAAVALLAYGDAMLGLPQADREAATDGEAGSGVSYAAARTVATLATVMRSHISSCGDADMMGIDDAAEGLRTALVTAQQQQQHQPHSTETALPLLAVPGALTAVCEAVLQHTTAHVQPADDAADVVQLCGAELRARLLPLASSFKSLTHTLQALVSASPSTTDHNVVLRCDGARVARWVAARLLDGVAAVPLTDCTEDAVLVACVRRWTDIAFSAAAAALDGGADGSDPVAVADAAAALLRVMEECTTLPLERLRLSEHATHALMTLLQGGDGDQLAAEEGEDSADSMRSEHKRDTALTGVGPSWHALHRAAAAQWGAAREWLAARCDVNTAHTDAPLADSTTALADELRAALPLADAVEGSRDRRVLAVVTALASAETALGLRRGLAYCEALLQRLHTHGLATQAKGHGNCDDDNNGRTVQAQRKRARSRERDDADADDLDSDDGSPLGEAEVVRCVRRLQALSHAILSRADGAQDAGAVVAAPSPLSITSASPAPVLSSVVLDAENGGAFFSVSDTESVGSRRVPSCAEVIDIE